MRKFSGIVAAMAAALAMTACGTDDEGGGSGSSPDEVVIGSIHPLTGPLAGAGQLMDQGAKLAVEDINKAGGIEALDGAELVLESGDSKGEAETGQSEAQRLIDGGAAALVGTYQSDVTLNVASVAERSRVPLVIDVAVDDQILEQGYQYTFRIQPDASSMGEEGADRLVEIAEQGGEKVDSVAYIHEEGAFGTSVFEAFKKQAESQGISVAKEITYSPTNFSDATTQVREAASVDPDVIVGTGYYPDQLLVAKAVQALSPDIQALYGVANGAFDDENFPNDAGAAGEGVLSANYHYNAASERTQDIRDPLREGVRRADADRGRPVLPGRRGDRAGAGGGWLGGPERPEGGHLGGLPRRPAARLRRTHRVRRDRPEHQRDRRRDAGPGRRRSSRWPRRSSRPPR